MAPIGTLYMYDPTSPGAHRAKRILATAAWTGAEITLAEGYKHKESNLTERFASKFPIQMVPAFETIEGEFISEGSAIALYVATVTNSGLIPSTPAGQAQVAQWQSFIDTEILPSLLIIYGISGGLHVGGKDVQVFRFKKVLTGLGRLDAFLATKEEGKRFLVGGGVTLADIAVVSGLVRGYTGIFDKDVQDKYPTLFSYFLSIVSHPKFASVWGDAVKVSTTSPIDLSD